MRIVEEILAGYSEVAERPVIAIVEHLLFEELPKPLDEVEVRGIGGQEDELDAGLLQVRLNRLGAVVACVVADDVDAGGVGIRQQDLIEQGDGRGGIDGVARSAPLAPGAPSRWHR